jgi:hypothetical protein
VRTALDIAAQLRLHGSHPLQVADDIQSRYGEDAEGEEH